MLHSVSYMHTQALISKFILLTPFLRNKIFYKEYEWFFLHGLPDNFGHISCYQVAKLPNNGIPQKMPFCQVDSPWIDPNPSADERSRLAVVQQCLLSYLGLQLLRSHRTVMVIIGSFLMQSIGLINKPHCWQSYTVINNVNKATRLLIMLNSSIT